MFCVLSVLCQDLLAGSTDGVNPATYGKLIHSYYLDIEHAIMLDLHAGPNTDLPQVLMHWVCAKIRAAGNMSDVELMGSIADRIKGQKGISFTQLANQAQDSGRKALAALLLDLETNAAEQVSSGLTMNVGDLIKNKSSFKQSNE